MVSHTAAHTSWFFHVADHVDGDPSVGGYHAGIRTAFKDGCEQVSVLFPFWTPVCRRLCQDAIVLKSDELQGWYEFCQTAIDKAHTRL